MLGSFTAEILKLRKRWAIRILVLIFLLVLVGLTYVLPYVIYKNPPPNFGRNLPRGTTLASLVGGLYPEHFHNVVLSSVNGLGAAIAIILGVMVMGGEYGWGTLKTIFTQKPRRPSVIIGKVAAVTVVDLLLGVVVMAAGAATSVVLALVDGHAFTWPDAGTIIGAAASLWLILTLWTMFGVALSAIFQQTALAMGIGLVYGFVVEGIVVGVFGSNPSLQNIEKAFPGVNASALADSFGQTLSRFNTAGPLMGATEAVLVLVGYTLAFLVITLVLTSQRDLA